MQLYASTSITLLSLYGALARPYPSSAPSVTIQNGTLVGQTAGVIDNFLGIPYAQPPVGPLRLRPPRSIERAYGTWNATSTPRSCPQQALGSFDSSGLPNATIEILESLESPFTGLEGEDCLTLNVQRPSGTDNNARLPVLFWIYGGAFETGNTQPPSDGTVIVNNSIQAGSPIIFVAVNYRVSAFGFMGGRELQEDGSTNLGLRDQRLGLQWVAENIAAFGGDPDKVTIWGESAGAASVYAQMVVNNGDHTYRGRPLFRAAIMDSGSELSTYPVDSAKAQATYDDMVELCECSGDADTLECLRLTPYDKFLAAQNAQRSFFGYAGLNLPFILRPDPRDGFYPISSVEATETGQVARVPMIIGNQEDEGTLFALAQRNLTTQSDLVQYLESYFTEARRKMITHLVNTYPKPPRAGSPFGTGQANELYPEFKRLAAMVGDFVFTLTRRHVLLKLAPVVPAWSYLGTYGYGTPYLGTSHISDIPEAFYNVPIQQVGLKIDQYYLNFVNTLNPNGKALATHWPRYDATDRQMLNISASGLSLLTDNFRQTSFNYLAPNFATFAF